MLIELKRAQAELERTKFRFHGDAGSRPSQPLIGIKSVIELLQDSGKGARSMMTILNF